MRSTTAYGPQEPAPCTLNRTAPARTEPAGGFDAELMKHVGKASSENVVGASTSMRAASGAAGIHPQAERTAPEQLLRWPGTCASAPGEEEAASAAQTEVVASTVVFPEAPITYGLPNALAPEAAIAAADRGKRAAVVTASSAPAPTRETMNGNVATVPQMSTEVAAGGSAGDALEIPTMPSQRRPQGPTATLLPAPDDRPRAIVRLTAAATYFQPELAKASGRAAVEAPISFDASPPPQSPPAEASAPSLPSNARSEAGDRQPYHSERRPEKSSTSADARGPAAPLMAPGEGAALPGVADQVPASKPSGATSASPVGAKSVLVGPALRTLELQIALGEIGELTAKLTSAETGMTVMLEVSSPEAADLLASQRDALVQGLASSGHVVDDVVVTAAPAKEATAGALVTSSSASGGAGQHAAESEGRGTSAGGQGAARDGGGQPSRGHRDDAGTQSKSDRLATSPASLHQSRGLSGGTLRIL